MIEEADRSDLNLNPLWSHFDLIDKGKAIQIQKKIILI